MNARVAGRCPSAAPLRPHGVRPGRSEPPGSVIAPEVLTGPVHESRRGVHPACRSCPASALPLHGAAIDLSGSQPAEAKAGGGVRPGPGRWAQKWAICARRRAMVQTACWREYSAGRVAQSTAHGALRIVALRDSRRAHTHPEHRRTAPKVVAAWRAAVAGGRRRASLPSGQPQPGNGRQRGAGVAPHSPATWHCSPMTFALRSLGVGAFTALACATSRSGPGWRCQEITERPRRGSTCQGEANPSTSPPSSGHLSRGRAKTRPAWRRSGPASPSSPATEAGHAPSLP